MAALDMRRPAEVTDAFRRRVGEALVPLGFVQRANGALVRKRGKVTHRVDFSSSHYNLPGRVRCLPALWYEDVRIAKRAPKWRAGGGLEGQAFAEQLPENIAEPGQAEAVFQRIVAGVSFFEALDDEARVFADVKRRYLPGLVDPAVVVPFLLVRLGAVAAMEYAKGLLMGRPELWPAFRSARDVARAAQAPKEARVAEHGTALAQALAAHGVPFDVEAPDDAVWGEGLRGASLRCFFGRQLRAWGEAEAAGALRRVEDARIVSAHVAQVEVAQHGLEGSLLDSAKAASRVLQLATGEVRAPKRERPVPRLFQYLPQMEPFGP